MSEDAVAPFVRLAKMIERELELAGQGRLAELREAVARRGELLGALPDPPPAAAQPALERARALHHRVLIEAQRLQESIELSRAALRRSRTVARTYLRPRGSRYSTSA